MHEQRLMVCKLQGLEIVEYRRVRGDIETLTLRITCGFYEAETVCSLLKLNESAETRGQAYNNTSYARK